MAKDHDEDEPKKKGRGSMHRAHIVNDNDNGDRLTPKHLIRQEFGRRLYKLMLARGWSQSELARRAGLPRDSVSTYIRGRVTPTPQSIEAMARALGVSTEQLLPNLIESAIEADAPALDIKASAADPTRAWLRVDRLVSMKTALAIATLLDEDDITYATRSGRPAPLLVRNGETTETDG